MMALDRRSERAVLDGLLAGARAGRSGALVVLGDGGVGKTALLECAVESSADLRVARATGVESEMEPAFAPLHQLSAPMLDRLDRLPGPQRDALAVTFGLAAGPVADRFLVGLALLSLLSEVADEQPLLCVIDDPQWLDRASAQVLAFVARRVLAGRVLMPFGPRDSSGELRDVPQLMPEGCGAMGSPRGPLSRRVCALARSGGATRLEGRSGGRGGARARGPRDSRRTDRILARPSGGRRISCRCRCLL
jgi:hypothetical protein